MRRARRTALASPSMAKGTFARIDFDFSELELDFANAWRENIRCTNVISGCADAAAAPRLRSAFSSSLLSAPLECRAIFLFQSACGASNRAARAISESGTQNHTTGAANLAAETIEARAPIFRARLFAFCRDLPSARTTTSSIRYPALRSDNANACARFPAPTIAMPGFAAMPGSIAGFDFSLQTSDLRTFLDAF